MSLAKRKPTDDAYMVSLWDDLDRADKAGDKEASEATLRKIQAEAARLRKLEIRNKGANP